ncbi:MAG: nitroreductase [Thermoplasmata archaeon M8B2D]|nr:MAG: nitroreductase [Thermoplasmata archaeon M8B2D]
MENYDLYPMIFKRKSIRTYDIIPLNEKILQKISDFLNSLQPMYDDIKTEFKIIPHNQVKRAMRKAPHYIAAFSENKAHYLTNIGFMLQQMNLFFSANEIGSCWQGIPQPTKEVKEDSNLEFVILMAFGKAKKTLYRMDKSEFIRKPLWKITDITGMKELLEAARLAPSSTNSQPWYFTGNETMIHAYIGNPGFLRRLFATNLLQIDLGIALFHMKLAAEHFGRKVTISYSPTAQTIPSKRFTYITTLNI